MNTKELYQDFNNWINSVTDEEIKNSLVSAKAQDKPFDEELFKKICEDYGVEFSDKYSTAMIRNEKGELHPLM